MALTWSRSTPAAAAGRPRRAPGAGDPGARLLAGLPAAAGAEPLADHLERLGPLPELDGAAGELRSLVAQGGLTGRGGAGFPTAHKLRAVAGRPGWPLVVVNGSESEPASRKDRALLTLRPHLVLDGAVVAAASVGADEAVIAVHGEASPWTGSLRRALAEQARAGRRSPSIRLAVAPPRYVAGESSALVAFLEGGAAKPRPGRRAAVNGVDGRPTLVLNAETVAHLALLTRRGAAWFRDAGSPGAPGSHLVTLVGAAGPQVLELISPPRLGDLLAGRGLGGASPAAVLLGGYGGAWVGGDEAADLTLGRSELAERGLPFGCGLIGLLPRGTCGIAETARLLAYLAAETAGQCGPCQYGLPAIAVATSALADGRASHRDVDRLRRRAAAIAGRGACHLPDGAVTLLDHALVVFADDVERHLRRGACRGAAAAPTFPVPAPPGAGGWR